MKALFALAAASLAVSPALAAVDAPSTSVSYEDLDLSSKEGQKTLDRRIAAAARSVCPAPQRTGTRISKPDRCYAEAVKKVRSQLASKGVGTAVAAR